MSPPAVPLATDTPVKRKAKTMFSLATSSSKAKHRAVKRSRNNLVRPSSDACLDLTTRHELTMSPTGAPIESKEPSTTCVASEKKSVGPSVSDEVRSVQIPPSLCDTPTSTDFEKYRDTSIDYHHLVNQSWPVITSLITLRQQHDKKKEELGAIVKSMRTKYCALNSLYAQMTTSLTSLTSATAAHLLALDTSVATSARNSEEPSRPLLEDNSSK